METDKRPSNRDIPGPSIMRDSSMSQIQSDAPMAFGDIDKNEEVPTSYSYVSENTTTGQSRRKVNSMGIFRNTGF